MWHQLPDQGFHLTDRPEKKLSRVWKNDAFSDRCEAKEGIDRSEVRIDESTCTCNSHWGEL